MTSDFLEEYLEDAKDHIASFERALFRLEQNIEDREALKNIFRASHSLKGSSYYMGFQNLGSVVHSVETMLEPLVKQNAPPSKELVDLLFKVLEFLEKGVDLVAKTGEDPDIPPELKELLDFPSTEVEHEEHDNEQASLPIVEEEYDEELLQIYIETVEEKLAELFKALTSVEFSQEEFLKQIEAIFDRLTSASRYMDFDRIVTFFETWESELKKATEARDPVSLALELCKENLKKLKELIPRINDEALLGLLDTGVKDKHELEASEVDVEDLKDDILPELEFLSQQIDNVFDGLGEDVEDITEEPEEEPLEVTDISEEFDLASQAVDSHMVPQHQGEQTLPFITVEEEKVAGEIEEELKEEIAPSQLLRVDPAKVDYLLNKVGELVIRRSEFDVVTSELKDIVDTWSRSGRIGPEEKKVLEGLHRRYSDTLTLFARLTRELQDAVMKIRMLPLMQLFSRFPRPVREHARELGKEVQLIVHGGDTELDRHLLEQLHEPLLHILRNAVFHGIEHPDERVAAGKPPKGTILINAYYKHQMVFIEVQDDGRGVDTERLKDVLVAQGVYSPEDVKNLDENKLLDSIFIAGVSTSSESTESAGRGIGLDIARQKCRAVNGQITVQTVKGHGTKFTIQIPLTLAIIPALLVLIENQVYTLPLANVTEVYDFDKSRVKKIKDYYVFTVEDKAIPLIFPEDIFPRLGVKSSDIINEDDQERYIVLLKTHIHEVGLVVNRFLGQQEVVIKPIEDSMDAIRGYTGATILGDGSISLIIDIADLISLMPVRYRNSFAAGARK